MVGNLIGTNAAGAALLGNGWYGVDIQGPAVGNMIGGMSPSVRNVISGNSLGGVHITLAGATGNTVEGNFIGIDVLGTLGIPNAVGVLIDTGASGNTIGGTAAGARQRDLGQHRRRRRDHGGLRHERRTWLQGNFIGTDCTSARSRWATAATASSLMPAPPCATRSAEPEPGGAGNLISGNYGRRRRRGFGHLQRGLRGTANNVVEGNVIGTGASGAPPPWGIGIGVVTSTARPAATRSVG